MVFSVSAGGAGWRCARVYLSLPSRARATRRRGKGANSFRITETGETAPRACVRVDRASVGVGHLALPHCMSHVDPHSHFVLDIPSTPSSDPWRINIQRSTPSSLFVDRELYSPLRSRFWPRIRLPFFQYPDLCPGEQPSHTAYLLESLATSCKKRTRCFGVDLQDLRQSSQASRFG